MKITSLLCLSFVLTTICACGFVKESRKATANVEVAVPPDSNTNATITLKPHFYPTDKLTLDAVGFEIRKVDLISPQGIKPLTYTYTDDLTLNI